MMIVGTGNIGKRLAEIAKVMGVDTYGVNSTGHPVDSFKECYSLNNWTEELPKMDIVVNILPLTSETTGLYDASVFAQIHPSAIFVNVGRGKSMNETDLIIALQTKQISFAALDVFNAEPLPEDSPLWDLENVLITPHISGVISGFKDKLLNNYFLPNLESFIKDQSVVLNQVDLDKGY
jgi:phosphoglycerate dehydrogenase-like enzyme